LTVSVATSPDALSGAVTRIAPASQEAPDAVADAVLEGRSPDMS
jgi:hypothetical protein